MSNYVPVVVALIAGPLAVLVTAYLSRDKVKTDATKTLTDISLSLVEPQMRRIDIMQSEINELREKVDKLEDENEALHVWAQHLVGQVVGHGGVPVAFDSSFLQGGDK